MSKHYVYLAGPIAGLSFYACTEWRDAVAKDLDSASIHCLTPMRGKTCLAGAGSISSGAYDLPIVTAKGVMGRDSFDAHRATALFVNFLGAKKISVGTVMEMAWAWKLGTPIVCVIEPDNCHQHIMLNETMTYQVPTIAEGVSLMKTLLEPEVESYSTPTCGYHIMFAGRSGTIDSANCVFCKAEQDAYLGVRAEVPGTGKTMDELRRS